MKLMLQSVIVVFLAASSGHADVKPGTIDAVAWVRGCAALTQTNAYADAMDSKCMATAVDFCELRPRAEISPCYDALIEYWDGESQQIIEALPDGQNLTGFAKSTVERMRARLTPPDYVPECTNLQGPQVGAKKIEICTLFQSAAKWIELRGLDRLANKNGRPVQ